MFINGPLPRFYINNRLKILYIPKDEKIGKSLRKENTDPQKIRDLKIKEVPIIINLITIGYPIILIKLSNAN